MTSMEASPAHTMQSTKLWMGDKITGILILLGSLGIFALGLALNILNVSMLLRAANDPALRISQ